MTFGGEELYPTIVDKYRPWAFRLFRITHLWMVINALVGHAAMETFLVLNGYQISASVDEQEQIILQVSSGEMEREAFTEWLRNHTEPIG